MTESTAAKAVAALRAAQLTLSTAESCTGGLIAKRVTDISGASAVFHGGVVSYVNEVKHGVLKVPREELDRFGAVSEPVARSMARGARRALHTDLAVSVTGVAGPGRDDRNNEVGTVFIALAFAEHTHCRLFHFEGDRDAIRDAAAEAALSLLLSYLAGELAANDVPVFTAADYDALKQSLHDAKDEGYRAFHGGLLPDTEDLLGVRTPALRQMAKQLLRGDYRGFLALARDDTYEERMLQGLVISDEKCPLSEKLEDFRHFIPKIDNWAICDMVAGSCKWKEAELPAVWDFFLPYLHSAREFEVRFAVVQLMEYFHGDADADRVLAAYQTVSHPGYYVTMALGWALSVFFVRQREKTLALLRAKTLSPAVQNTAIRKCRESLRVSAADKVLLSSLRLSEA